MTLDERLRSAFRSRWGREPEGMVRAPGRVNLIGEHTDYNDGFVLPCAIGVETRIAWARRTDRKVRVLACDYDSEIDQFEFNRPVAHHAEGGWRDYVRAMVDTLRTEGTGLVGVDLAVAGDIPRGAGLSSSASLEVAVAHAMLAAADSSLPANRVALLAQAAENDFVGMNCGIMDQLASAAGIADAALMIDCRDLSTQPVAFPRGVAIAIIHSGVQRGLVDGHYNRRRAECEAAASAMGVASLRDADAALVAVSTMPVEIRARARHVVTENARVLAAAEALGRGNLERMGRLMAESHESMRDDFCITVPKIDELVAVAQNAIGPDGGARMTGGGFGGAIVALFRADRAAEILAHISTRYRTPTDMPPVTMLERPAPGAGPVSS